MTATSYHTYTDTVLAGLLKNGDSDAYTEIYNRYEGVLFVHAYKRLGVKEDARDIVQELFIRLWEKREALELTGSLKAYLYVSIRNRIINLFAGNKHQTVYLESLQQFAEAGTVTADSAVRLKELMEIVDREIDALPAKMREIFLLSRNEQLSHRQIAEQLEISELTVKSQVHGALKILKAKLGPLFSLLFL